MPLASFLPMAVRRLIAALLLAVVAAHAATPLASPLDRHKGSAFSSATADVSLKSGGKAIAAKPALRLEPPLPGTTMRPPATGTIPALANFGGLPETRAPPAGDTTFAPLAPRAPPAA